MANKSKISTFTIKVNTDNGKVKIDGVTKSFQKAENAYKKLNNTIKSGGLNDGLSGVAGGAEKVAKSSGSAAASVTEMGRVISDAPYGIRGVANNLSQLASNFAQTANKVDETTGKTVGFKGALSGIGQAFMGPLGILVAIQAGLAILEMWSMRAKEAKFSTEVYGNSITENSAKLQILTMALNDTNLTTEQQISIMQENKEGLEDMGFEVGNTEEAMYKLKEAMEAEMIVMQKRAVAQGFANVIQEQSNKIAEMIANGVEGNVQWYEKLAIQLGLTGQAFAGLNKEQISQALTGSKLNDANELVRKSYAELTKVLDDGDMYINYLTDGGKKNGAGKRARALKIFKQQFLDLESIILNNEKQLTLLSTRNEVERLKIQKSFADADIDRRLENFEEKQKIRLADYLKSIEGHEKEEELAKEAREKAKTSVEEAEVEAGEAKLAIRLNYAEKIGQKELEIIMSLRKKATDMELKNSTDLFNMLDPSLYKTPGADFEMQEDRMDRREFLEDNLAQAQQGGNEGEIQNAQIALNEFNQKLREEDIMNEEAYYQDKRNIAMEYVGFLGQTADLFKALAGDNEKMQKAALIMEKSAATANVIIQTQEAIASRRMGNLMMAAQGPIGVEKAKLDKLAMKKDIARAKTSAALSIANIWATGWGSKSVKGGGSDSGNQGREFDFNLVGSTGQNQLAQTTAGQLNQPVQAFVVSSEITSQQQMDNVIQTNASFGDND